MLSGLRRNPVRFASDSACHVIAMLARDGALPRSEAARFLCDCYSLLKPQQDCYVWHGWLDAVALLGLADLKPLVEQAFARGSVNPGWLSFKDFESDLYHSLEHPNAGPPHPDGDLTLFGETIAELSCWHCFRPQARTRDRDDWAPRGIPYVSERNPFRKVGRNDPCPCGSGKKFKKCCLTSDLDTELANDILNTG